MDFKLIGCILLIIGTSIGAGMLALPIATAEVGFFGAVSLLIFCWFIMTVGAFYILESNLWLPQKSNLISMAGATIGPMGQIIAWITYLLLLYSLLCAYISGGAGLLHGILVSADMHIPLWLSACLFTLFFGSIVYLGIRSIDYVNRGLMLIKLGSYFLLVGLLARFISFDKLEGGQLSYITSTQALTISIVSFGYASIVPSLRVYFEGNVKKLKTAIIIGSVIPLLLYIIWDAVNMGIIPISGDNSFQTIMHSDNSTNSLVATLSAAVSKESIHFFIKLFTSICVLTSFLGVSLCLVDFLADGFQLEKVGLKNLFIHAVAFLPPLVVVLFFPNAFITALQYGGVYCIILLVILPAWMVWCGRYRKKFTEQFTVRGGKPLLIFLIIFSFIMIIKSVLPDL